MIVARAVGQLFNFICQYQVELRIRLWRKGGYYCFTYLSKVGEGRGLPSFSLILHNSL